MDLLIFTLNGIVIYLFSDWVLRQFERRSGAVLKHRQILFFVIFLTLALVSFALIRQAFP